MSELHPHLFDRSVKPQQKIEQMTRRGKETTPAQRLSLQNPTADVSLLVAQLCDVTEERRADVAAFDSSFHHLRPRTITVDVANHQKPTGGIPCHNHAITIR